MAGQKHKCDICGVLDFWGKDWLAWDSPMHSDAGLSPVKSCSDKCRSGLTIRQLSVMLKAKNPNYEDRMASMRSHVKALKRISVPDRRY